MTFRNLLIIKAIVCLCFGFVLLFAPVTLYSLLGAALNDGGPFAAREYAAAMFGTLFLCWFAKDVRAQDARGAILLDFLVYDLIGVVITASVSLSGLFNALGWAIVVVYLFFTVGSAYLLIKEKPFQQPKESEASVAV